MSNSYVNTNDVPVASSKGLQDYAISQGTGTAVAGSDVSFELIIVVGLIVIGGIFLLSRVA